MLLANRRAFSSFAAPSIGRQGMLREVGPLFLRLAKHDLKLPRLVP